jgi:hypothetical protein
MAIFEHTPEGYRRLLAMWHGLAREPAPSLVRFLRDEAARRWGQDDPWVDNQEICEFITGRLGLLAADGEVAHLRRVRRGLTEVDTNRGGRYRGGKVFWFEFKGDSGESVRHDVRGWDWCNLPPALCGLVAAENRRTFHRATNIVGNRRPYFARDPGELKTGDRSGRDSGRIVPGTDIYVQCNLSANNAVSLCRAVLGHFGYTRVHDEADGPLFRTSADDEPESASR